MIDIEAIKERHPDWQVNALGGKDMQDIRILITEVESLSVEVTSLRRLVRAVASETSIPMEEIEQSIDAASNKP